VKLHAVGSLAELTGTTVFVESDDANDEKEDLGCKYSHDGYSNHQP